MYHGTNKVSIQTSCLLFSMRCTRRSASRFSRSACSLSLKAASRCVCAAPRSLRSFTVNCSRCTDMRDSRAAVFTSRARASVEKG